VDTRDLAAIAGAVLVPVVTTLLGAMGILFKEWRSRRDAVRRRAYLLADATAQATFIEQWWRALRALTDAPEQLGKEAAEAESLLLAARRSIDQLPYPCEQSADRPGVLRRMLLLYRLNSTVGRIFAYLFWFCLVILLLLYLTFVTDAVHYGFYSAADGFFGSTAFLALPLLLFRALAVLSEDRGSKRSKLRRSLHENNSPGLNREAGASPVVELPVPLLEGGRGAGDQADPGGLR
jgi:hypothetical protein